MTERDDLVARLAATDMLRGFTTAERIELIDLGIRDPEVRRRYYDLAMRDGQRVVDSLAASRRTPRPSRWGNLHLHRRHVDGCYRCELRADEATA